MEYGAAATAAEPMKQRSSMKLMAVGTSVLAFASMCVVYNNKYSPAVAMVEHISNDNGKIVSENMSMYEAEKVGGARLYHTDHMLTTYMDKQWDIHHGVEFQPQMGGSMADRIDGYWDTVTALKTAAQCAARATDDGLAMWVFDPKKRTGSVHFDRTCSMARRMPLSSLKKPGSGIISGKTKWLPNFKPEGMLSYADAPGGVAETAAVRFKGQMYVMESVEGMDPMSPTLKSAFRIRELATGKIIANVENANGHAFFAANVDHARGVAWIYGSAHNRGSGEDGPCDPHTFDKKGNRCHIGAWTSTDMINWSLTKKAFLVPKGTWVGNVAVAMVTGTKYDTTKLPPHQGVMALEYCDNAHCEQSGREKRYCFAINKGSDGKYAENWEVLGNEYCPIGMHSCPSLNYDAEEGYYYMTGGGSRINGPDRSKDLIHWERSPLHPASRPSTDLDAPFDNKVSPYYTDVWAKAPKTAFRSQYSAKKLMSPKWMTKWNWGHSDMDFCCNDGQSPSYAVYISSPQSHPKRYVRDTSPAGADSPWPVYLGIGKHPATLDEWMRSYFPSPGATYCGATNIEDC